MASTRSKTESNQSDNELHGSNNVSGNSGITFVQSVDGGLTAAAHEIAADAIDANLAVYKNSLNFAGDTFMSAVSSQEQLVGDVLDFARESRGSEQHAFEQTLSTLSGNYNRNIESIDNAYKASRATETAQLAKYALGIVGVVIGGFVLFSFFKK